MPLNRRRLDEIAGMLGPVAAAELLAKLPQGLARNLAELRAARDAVEARLSAHKLKGLAVLYGLDDLAAAALAIETRACGPSSPEVLADLERIAGEGKALLDEFVRELRARDHPA